MRVILVGSASGRARLRARLDGTGIEVVGESPSVGAAKAAAACADAILMSPDIHGGGTDFVEPLTGREIQVLELLAEGLANKAIAGQLGISDQTVKVHVASILGKLNAANRTEAVRRAARTGLISL
jgi:ATP/maltotriose-dependent transcriptional regulator MalT